MAEPVRKTPPKAPALIAAAVLLALPLTKAFEGLVTTPGHKDPAGYSDICYGDRTARQRTYTADECAVLLASRQQRDYAPPVLKCVPAIGTRSYIFAASVDAAYNAGAGAFCRSPMAALFNAGRWSDGCNAFIGWRATANGKPLAGLVRRRQAEAALCRRGIA